ncbi:MAG: adenine phosphoribosyltransferase [Candidatus Delongbacteria bacterium]|nr:adenine phosphoribosyltransferase [Candidatus Delongbacteria bacterium]
MYDQIKSQIRTIPDWPKPGIMFRDITTLIKHPDAFAYTIDVLVERYSRLRIQAVAGIESRGFIFGGALAHRLRTGFIPIRKKGKLPAETVVEEYELEYGTDRIEVHKDAVLPDTRVLMVDDLIATGGTAMAACRLITRLGAHVVECCFIIDLPDLGGKKRLVQAGYNVHTLVEFEGD